MSSMSFFGSFPRAAWECRAWPRGGLIRTAARYLCVATQRVTTIKLSRHTGRDCRNPDYKDVKSHRHPWPLDPGNPCQGDAGSVWELRKKE
ncbi:hypothetical protein [Methylomonas methanica]|uniref:hypothetical protein n=1 Tax=Methylomonas methanica TaxID=421 RepID=UPI000ACC86CE|nr:hypothetical protein [Methylomonas methanica]